MLIETELRPDMPKLGYLPLSLGLAPYCVRWFNDCEVRQFLDESTPRTEEEISRWLAEIIGDSSCRYLTIVDLETVLPIGHIGLKGIDRDNKSAELAIVIGEKSYWGRGLGTIVLEEIVRVAFDEFSLEELKAKIAGGNTASIQLFKKCGFSQVERENDLSIFVLRRESKKYG